MVKILSFILLVSFLFSCNGLSDEEMDIRLAELELMQLANEHLAEDIDGLWQMTDAKMALPENKAFVRPLLEKFYFIQSLVDSSIQILESESIDSIQLFNKYFYNSIIDTIALDSLNLIHFEGESYKNVQLVYSYANFSLEFDSLYHTQIEFIKSLSNPSELEWMEINELCKSYYLLSQKASMNYLTQLYISPIHNQSNRVNLYIEIPRTKFKPKENLTFNINPSVPYSTNFSKHNYFYDDSLIYDSYLFNQPFIDSILVPTNEIGKHQLRGTKYFGKVSYKTDSIFNYTYDYEVIENK